MLSVIFGKVFDSEMPNPEHAQIIGAFEDGRIEGFVVLERPVVIWEFFVRDDKRNSRISRNIVKWVRSHTPAKQAVGALVQNEKFGMLLRTLGLDEIKGKLFWRN